MLQVCAVDFTAFHLLRPLFRAARADGWNVTFACADGPWAGQLRGEGFSHWRVPISRGHSPLAHAAAIARLAGHLRHDPPDVVHTHTPIGGMIGRMAAMTWRGPLVHTFHGLPFEIGDRSLTTRAFIAVERLLARRSTRFFSQARGDALRAVALGIARRDDLTVIGNGIDVDRWRPDAEARERARAELGIPADAVVVLLAARLVREKGLIELADAALALGDRAGVHFLIAGSSLPSDRTAVETDLDAHAVRSALGDRWRRLGHRADLGRLMRAADIFALPTYREGLPRSIIEAMASGLPVVASDISACRELVREGETGLLVPSRDAAALARALGALAADPEARARMGRRGREIAAAEHDERVVLARQLEIFRRLAPS